MAATYRGSVTSTANATSYNLTSPNLGAGAAGQAIFCFIAASNDGSGAGTGISSVTIDGDAMSAVHGPVFFPSASDMELGIALYGRMDDDGGTPTISVNWTGGGSDLLGLQLYTATNMDNGITPVASGDARLAAVNIATAAGGFLIAAFVDWATVAGFTWTGATEDNEEVIEFNDGENVNQGCASIASTTGSSTSVRPQASGNWNVLLIAASFAHAAAPAGNPWYAYAQQ